MFYLTTHSTHFIHGYMASDMVKDHSDSEKGNPLPPHRLLFPINSKASFICTISDRIAHTMTFVTPVMEHWLEREIAQWFHPMKDRSDYPSHHERTLLPRSYISLRVCMKAYVCMYVGVCIYIAVAHIACVPPPPQTFSKIYRPIITSKKD